MGCQSDAVTNYLVRSLEEAAVQVKADDRHLEKLEVEEGLCMQGAAG